MNPRTNERPIAWECSLLCVCCSGECDIIEESVPCFIGGDIGRSSYNARIPSGIITVRAVPTNSPAPNKLTFLSLSWKCL